MAARACGASSADRCLDCTPPSSLPPDMAARRLVALWNAALALGYPVECGSSHGQDVSAQVTWGHLALGLGSGVQFRLGLKFRLRPVVPVREPSPDPWRK